MKYGIDTKLVCGTPCMLKYSTVIICFVPLEVVAVLDIEKRAT